jgi:hypothetical protein
VRRLILPLLLSIGVWAPAVQAAQGLEAEVRVEERLLAADLRAYQEAREQERGALAELEEATARLDAALSAPAPRSGDAEDLDAERQVALAAAEVVARRVGELRRRLLERLRRGAALREEILRGAALPAPADPITGRWRVEVSSPREAGTFQLRLAGTVVEGTYSFDGGRSGSLRGTYVGNRLSLDRLDGERGLDGLFEGTVDAAAGAVRGFWTPTRLSGGAPGGAGWSGVRVEEPRAEEEPE